MLKSAKIVGEVRGFHERSEEKRRWFPEPHTRQEYIWDFRLERYDSAGNRLPPIPVEMRGRSFEGGINEGDQVELHSDWKEGETVHVTQVRNLTTSAIVKATG